MHVKNNVKKENCRFKNEYLSNSKSVKNKVSDVFGAWKDFDVKLLKKRTVELREVTRKRKLARF